MCWFRIDGAQLNRSKPTHAATFYLHFHDSLYSPISWFVCDICDVTDAGTPGDLGKDAARRDNQEKDRYFDAKK